MSYDKAICVRMPKKDLEGIEKCVENGHASSISDFVKMAVRNEIGKCMAGA